MPNIFSALIPFGECLSCLNTVSISAAWFEIGGGYSHIFAIRVCAAGEGMVFKPFGLVKGMVFKSFGLVEGMVFKPFGLVQGPV